MKTKKTEAREKVRLRSLKKWHANKDRYAFRDVLEAIESFWAKRGGIPHR